VLGGDVVAQDRRNGVGEGGERSADGFWGNRGESDDLGGAARRDKDGGGGEVSVRYIVAVQVTQAVADENSKVDELAGVRPGEEPELR
jgi:hypothetical protein